MSIVKHIKRLTKPHASYVKKCKKCNYACYAIHFQHNFVFWTSGDKYINKFIQDTQLSAHDYTKVALEWIPYDRLYDVKYISKDEFGKVYRANWIDGYIICWNNCIQDWQRDRNMFVNLKSLNTSRDLTLEFTNKTRIEYEYYGITQDPETKNYMMVLNNKCKKCNRICYTMRFQHKFIDWTSGNSDIDKLIQDTQLSTHDDANIALEWIPYDRLYDIKYIAKDKFGKVFRASWIDGYINNWNNIKQDWKRKDRNMFVNLKNLNTLKDLTLEFINKIKLEYKFYGITQDPITKSYMMVLNNLCKTCNRICYTIHLKHKFIDWTSGDNDIDKFIQDTQLSTHNNAERALEWIPYDRLYDIKHIAKDKFGKVYRANWMSVKINWDNENPSWNGGHNVIVILKHLNNINNITDEIDRTCGITQNPKTKKYMLVLNEICKKCNGTCNTIRFYRNFDNWTSGNDDIDKFIQGTQLSEHSNLWVRNVIEWIPYYKLYDIEYISKGGFSKVYKAKWINGYLTNWDNEDQNWQRCNQNIYVALKSLNDSKNGTLEFMNEIMLHNEGRIDNSFVVRFYGITQDPKTKNYMMVLDYAEDGSLRNYLDKEYNKLNWNKKMNCLQHIVTGLRCIHEKELIHRDLHIGNILKLKYKTAITDMGLCKPVNYNALENTGNKIYGVLPYIAPEILIGKNYTQASDIYSFGIIMYEVISGLPPYYNICHDNYLAMRICQGLRPRFNIKVPKLIIYLIKRCLDADPLNRPTANEIYKILHKWYHDMQSDNQTSTELQKQIEEADKINKNLSNNCMTSINSGISYNTHSGAIYKSRLLNFNGLSEPRNSDDYYEHNDNIISKEFSDQNSEF